MTLTDEQRNQLHDELKESRDELELMESSARVFITMIDKVLDGEITHHEFEGFLLNHEHLVENLHL